MKLFAAIPISDRVSGDVTRLQKGVSGARWVAREKFHITLGFFGEVSDDMAEVLDMELGRAYFPAFELQLSGVGHFRSNPPVSLWAGVKPVEHIAYRAPNVQSRPLSTQAKPLIDLHKFIKKAARKASIEMERRDFRPHLTLAYLSRDTPLDRIIAFKTAHARYTSARFLVDRFYLYSSTPHHNRPNTYRIEARYPLLAPQKRTQ